MVNSYDKVKLNELFNAAVDFGEAVSVHGRWSGLLGTGFGSG